VFSKLFVVGLGRRSFSSDQRLQQAFHAGKQENQDLLSVSKEILWAGTGVALSSNRGLYAPHRRLLKWPWHHKLQPTRKTPSAHMLQASFPRASGRLCDRLGFC